MAVTEYDFEPVRGLPEDLPAGERILWQGAPHWRTLAPSILFNRWIAVYFAALALMALVSGNGVGAAAITVSGILTLGLITLFAYLVARTTVYTITDRRVVLRIGVALNKCINLPLAHIGAANLRLRGGGTGDLAMVPAAAHGLGYAFLWPHVRPLHIREPQPMMRAVPEAEKVAAILRDACAAIVPVETAPAEQAAATQPASQPANSSGRFAQVHA